MENTELLSIFNLVAQSPALTTLNEVLKSVNSNLKLVWNGGVSIKTIWEDDIDSTDWALECRRNSWINNKGEVEGESNIPTKFSGTFTLFYGTIPIGVLGIMEMPLTDDDRDMEKWAKHCHKTIGEAEKLLNSALATYGNLAINLKDPGLITIDVATKGATFDKPIKLLVQPGAYVFSKIEPNETPEPKAEEKKKRGPKKRDEHKVSTPEDDEIRQMVLDQVKEREDG